jgi:hypothetical protein
MTFFEFEYFKNNNNKKNYLLKNIHIYVLDIVRFEKNLTNKIKNKLKWKLCNDNRYYCYGHNNSEYTIIDNKTAREHCNIKRANVHLLDIDCTTSKNGNPVIYYKKTGWNGFSIYGVDNIVFNDNFHPIIGKKLLKLVKENYSGKYKKSANKIIKSHIKNYNRLLEAEK